MGELHQIYAEIVTKNTIQHVGLYLILFFYLRRDGLPREKWPPR